MVKDDVTETVIFTYFKKGVERAEVDADVSIFQTKYKINNLEGVSTILFYCQNIVQT